MKKTIYIALLLSTCLILVSAQPKTNPLSAFYAKSEGYPTWTDEIHWNRVIDMSSYANGTNDFEKFENARDQLYNVGGGVLYYPAGTYNFSSAPVDGPDGRGLMLKSGVVIRGEAPVLDGNATDGKMALPTKFIFPMKAVFDASKAKIGEVPGDWNIIGLKPSGSERIKDVNNVGICWVNLVGAVVYFGADLNWTSKWSESGSWYSALAKSEDRNGYNWQNRVPDGTHPIDPFAGSFKGYVGAGSGRLVFGCVLEDAAVVNNGIDYGMELVKLNGGTATTHGNKDFLFQYKFGSRIGVYGQHVFVGNNIIPRSTKNFKFSQLMGNTKSQSNASSCIKDCSTIKPETTIFDYGKQHGIDINKDLLGWNLDEPLDAYGNYESPGLYEKDVIVKGNWVFNHGHKGYNVSGKWVVVSKNHNERSYLLEGDTIYGLSAGWMLSSNGFLRTAMGNGCISENFSRAFDMAGQAGWVDGNSYNNTGSSPGCDGEGILWQHHGGTQFNSYALTNNAQLSQKGNGCGSANPGYQGGYNVNVAGAFIAWNKTFSFIGNTACTGTKKETDAAYINNGSDALGGVKVCNAGNDVITGCTDGVVAKPAILTTSMLADSTGVEITWQDNSINEIAFKVQRSITDTLNWKTIAYRPRKSQGCPENEQKWIDYLAPRNCVLYYRVVAVNCNNDDNAATYSTPAMEIPSRLFGSITGLKKVEKYNIDLFPSPATKEIFIKVKGFENRSFGVAIYSCTGKLMCVADKFVSGQTIELQNFTSGFYVAVLNLNNEIIRKKILVVR